MYSVFASVSKRLTLAALRFTAIHSANGFYYTAVRYRSVTSSSRGANILYRETRRRESLLCEDTSSIVIRKADAVLTLYNGIYPWSSLPFP